MTWISISKDFSFAGGRYLFGEEQIRKYSLGHPVIYVRVSFFSYFLLKHNQYLSVLKIGNLSSKVYGIYKLHISYNMAD